MNLIIFVIATIGLANILLHGVILDDEHLGLRSWIKKKLGKFGDVFECSECVGFWSGMFMSLLTLLPDLEFTGVCSIITGIISVSALMIVGAFSGAAIMHIYNTLILFIESKTDFIINDHE